MLRAAALVRTASVRQFSSTHCSLSILSDNAVQSTPQRKRTSRTRKTGVDRDMRRFLSTNVWPQPVGYRRQAPSLPSAPASRMPRLHCHPTEQRRTHVFVSRFNNALNLTSQTILEYCSHHIGSLAVQEARSTSSHVILKECPFCKKPHHNKPDNLYKLYIQVGGGAYFCHRCGAKGSWYDFKAQFGAYSGGGAFHSIADPTAGGSSIQGGSRDGTTGGSGRGGRALNGSANYVGDNSRSPRLSPSFPVSCLPMPSPRLAAAYNSLLLDHVSKTANDDRGLRVEKDGLEVLDYLTRERGLTRSTLRKYGVGRATYKFPTKNEGYVSVPCVTFPWMMRASDVAYQEEMRGATFVYDQAKERAKGQTQRTNEEAGSTKNIEGKSGASGVEDESKYDSHDSDVPTPGAADGPCLPEGDFVARRIKVRALSNKSWQRMDPPGGGWGLFGLHTVPDDASEVILTEGEYDAMAVWQATGRPAISLPNGCRSLPPQALPLLERFEKIYLWMDNDGPGQEGAKTFSKKIGVARCCLVKCPDAKDANDALLKGLDMNKFLSSARPLPHERIITFPDLRSQVLHEVLNPDQYSGVPVPSLPGFTKLIKGFRRGELTVLTGPTGSGKTTFLGQLSLDLVEQGISCLWGSFEIKNTRLIHKMLQQYARKPLLKGTDDGKNAKSMEQLEALADNFESLPLYFMGFHGGSDVDEVLDAMEYAVYVNDVEHIILDNMQFMISRNALTSSKFDKFDVQDVAIEKFRKFSSDHNVHVTLVVHPRKEDETAKLNLSSFYGTAKATQEADTVLILQNDGRRKYLEVKKNRFDGTLGYIPLFFQRTSGRYSENEDQAAPEQTERPSKKQLEQQALDTFWEESFKRRNG